MLHAVVCSKHDKATLIAPALAPLGYRVVETDLFDTDSLGTFCGTRTRTLSPIEAATTKAQRALELTDADVGIGSEGSQGDGPAPGLLNWDEEVLCLIFRDTGQCVIATTGMPVSIAAVAISPAISLPGRLSQWPAQRWMYQQGNSVKKGMTAEEATYLVDTQPVPDEALLLPDLRAMYCPERQEVIKACAADLAVRLQSPCPRCAAPDFSMREAEAGQLCEACFLPTPRLCRTLHRCTLCSYAEWHTITGYANPFYCPQCNP